MRQRCSRARGAGDEVAAGVVCRHRSPRGDPCGMPGPHAHLRPAELSLALSGVCIFLVGILIS